MHYSFDVRADLEHVSVILKPNSVKRKNIEIVGVYRPLLNDFFCSLESVMNNLGVNNDQILAGDFNICGIASSPNRDKYLDIMRSYDCMPHINRITRLNPRRNDSCLDHIWSNFGFTFKSGVFNEVIISDHFIDFVFLPIEYSTTKKKNKFQRSF